MSFMRTASWTSVISVALSCGIAPAPHVRCGFRHSACVRCSGGTHTRSCRLELNATSVFFALRVVAGSPRFLLHPIFCRSHVVRLRCVGPATAASDNFFTACAVPSTSAARMPWIRRRSVWNGPFHFPVSVLLEIVTRASLSSDNLLYGI